jgi:DNA-binding MarR family transcriptional regulator
LKWKVVDNPERSTTLNGGIDQKIVAALERISQALRALSWSSGKSLSLNPAQAQVIVFLYEHPRLSSRISLMAKEFGISVATMSDTIRLLEEKHLVRKNFPEPSSRNFTLKLTDKGAAVAVQARQYAEVLRQVIAALPAQDNVQLLDSLSDIIFGLYRNDVSPVQRMCKTCKFHDQLGGETYCHLLRKPLGKAQIQLDCPDHLQLQSYHKPFR